MTFSHPFFLTLSLVIAGIAAVLSRSNSGHFRVMCAGLTLIAVAAGGPVIWLHPSKAITVMVDLSPSTRGAAYRDRAALMHRIAELAGDIPVQIVAFADHVQALPSAAILPDLPCAQTRFDPAATDAILLFSDGQFALPEELSPTYPIIDPLLISPPDAAVTEMRFDGKEAMASVRNAGAGRQLTWTDTSQRNQISVGTGRSTIRGGDATGRLVQARLDAGDLWPENDSLALPAQEAARLQFWWVGSGTPAPGWTSIKPADLPSDSTDYLPAAAIALSNVAAMELSDTQRLRLSQFVRDLGGSLLIFGGDHAYAAGGYSGTELETLSPLASDPPKPTTHWMLLVDSSGSMAQSVSGRSQLDAAVEAVTRLIPILPPKDPVTIGSFARDLSWWIEAQPAENVARLAIPPTSIGAGGPTNLEPVLEKIASRQNTLVTELLLLTDADTTIASSQGLGAKLKAAKIRVSLLALQNVSADNPVVQIVTATGGHWLSQDDPSHWIDSLRQLMHSQTRTRLENTQLALRFAPSLGLPERSIESWNHTWPKTGSTKLAGAPLTDQQIALGAQWRVGLGMVASFAFVPTNDEAKSLATKLVSTPRDPRFKTSWQCDATLKVSVDAIDGTEFLNGLHFKLKLGDQAIDDLHQTAPGEYSIERPASPAPLLATLQLDGRVIDRRAIAGRYAQEFENIGNDDSALAELAASSGGSVIAPAQHSPIKFNWPARQVKIDQYVLAAGALVLAAGKIASRTPYAMARSVR